MSTMEGVQTLALHWERRTQEGGPWAPVARFVEKAQRVAGRGGEGAEELTATLGRIISGLISRGTARPVYLDWVLERQGHLYMPCTDGSGARALEQSFAEADFFSDIGRRPRTKDGDEVMGGSAGVDPQLGGGHQQSGGGPGNQPLSGAMDIDGYPSLIEGGDAGVAPTGACGGGGASADVGGSSLMVDVPGGSSPPWERGLPSAVGGGGAGAVSMRAEGGDGAAAGAGRSNPMVDAPGGGSPPWEHSPISAPGARPVNLPTPSPEPSSEWSSPSLAGPGWQWGPSPQWQFGATEPYQPQLWATSSQQHLQWEYPAQHPYQAGYTGIGVPDQQHMVTIPHPTSSHYAPYAPYYQAQPFPAPYASYAPRATPGPTGDSLSQPRVQTQPAGCNRAGGRGSTTANTGLVPKAAPASGAARTGPVRPRNTMFK